MKLVYVIAMVFLVACSPANQMNTEKAHDKSIPSIMPEKVAKPVAVLAVQSGTAMVNGNPAGGGRELKEGDRVKTSSGAKASIVFFDSTIMRLDENTEIIVKKLVAEGARKVELEQTAGSTWSRVLKISGVKEYTVDTPTTVATVRGTGFAVRVSHGKSMVAVKEGTVHVASYEDGRMMAETNVPANMEIHIADEKPEVMEPVAMVADEWIEENAAHDEEFIDNVVHDYMEEHPEVVGAMDDHMSADEIQDRVQDYVEGDISEEQLNEEPAPEETREEPVDQTVHEPADDIVHDAPVEHVEDIVREEVPIDQPVDEPVQDATTYSDAPADAAPVA